MARSYPRVLSLRLTDDDAVDLARMAEESGRTQVDVVRRLIRIAKQTDIGTRYLGVPIEVGPEEIAGVSA
jgi:hypothetical protein